MRERLVAVLVGLTVAVVVCYGVPRAYFLADLVESQETERAERTADLVSLAVAERLDGGSPVTEDWLSTLATSGEGIVYTGPDGTVVTAGDAAADGSQADAIVERRDVDRAGEVAVSRDRSAVDARVAEAILPLVVLGLALVALSILAGIAFSRLLSRPFQRLATAAEELGTGRFDVEVPHSRVPEAEAIGDALRRSATQLDDLVTRERDRSVRASHELMTPVAAVRLELEDLALWPQTPPELAEEIRHAVGSLDQLAGRIEEVLRGDRAQRLGAARSVDLRDLAAAALQRWRPRVEAAGRHLHLSDGRPVPVTVLGDEVAQVVDGLLAEALEHGQGTITLDVGREPTYVRISVRDEGPRRGDADVLHRREGAGTATGLALAAERAEALGGYVVVPDGPTASLVLMLPPAPSRA